MDRSFNRGELISLFDLVFGRWHKRCGFPTTFATGSTNSLLFPGRVTDGPLLKLERVSKIPPESNPEAGEVEEGIVSGEQMLMTHQQAAELSEPRVGSLHDP